ncbi:TolB family protein [Catelliglobosispora koreensis]|uniref:TolB family protein n=1 Tax=Catelliglobosispora koreensis TaxID=129052 RepID=UPI000475C36A|nr:PD40 domain-containing protein [Catelliglobosispora koreensis]
MKLVFASAVLLLSTVVASPAQAKPGTGDVFAPGVISTDAEEYRIVFDLDGDTAYFGRGQDFFPISREATIMVSRKVNGAWTAATPAPFSGTHSDLDPFITPDGSRLFFSSIRPVGGAPRSDVDLWMVRRTSSGWSSPQHLGSVNSPSDELYPSVALDGTLYFASDRTGEFDIYRSRPLADGTYGPAESLGAPVNTAGWEFNPVILPGGNVLFFTGLERAGGQGLGDQWVSVRIGGRWTTPRNLGPAINTAADEYHLSFSPGYDRVYFVRHTYDPWVPGDLYTMPTWKLIG